MTLYDLDQTAGVEHKDKDYEYNYQEEKSKEEIED